MAALGKVLSGWASTVGVFFLASLVAHGVARENLAKLQEQDSPEMTLVIFMQVMAQPPLILLIGFMGVMVILGVHLLNESRNWGRW